MIGSTWLILKLQVDVPQDLQHQLQLSQHMWKPLLHNRRHLTITSPSHPSVPLPAKWMNNNHQIVKSQEPIFAMFRVKTFILRSCNLIVGSQLRPLQNSRPRQILHAQSAEKFVETRKGFLFTCEFIISELHPHKNKFFLFRCNITF